MLRTRGDNTLLFDPPFPSDQTLGVVRACRRGRKPAPILDGGREAVVAAGISLLAGRLLAGTERLPATLRPPARRVVSIVVSGSVLALGRSRALTFRQKLQPPDSTELPEAGSGLPEID
jgi:hypothetical protein